MVKLRILVMRSNNNRVSAPRMPSIVVPFVTVADTNRRGSAMEGLAPLGAVNVASMPEAIEACAIFVAAMCNDN